MNLIELDLSKNNLQEITGLQYTPVENFKS